PMTLEAQRPHVGQIALAAAFHYRHDMVGIPEMLAAAPVLFELAPCGVVELALIFTQRLGVHAANRADAAIAREDLLPQVTGVGAELPFVHAGRAAEGPAPSRNVGAAPAARCPLPPHPSSGFGAASAHTRSS